LTAVVFFYRTW